MQVHNIWTAMTASSYVYSATTQLPKKEIFMKFYTGDFLLKIYKPNWSLIKSLQITGILQEDLHIWMINSLCLQEEYKPYSCQFKYNMALVICCGVT